jgi:hypothetical protein
MIRANDFDQGLTTFREPTDAIETSEPEASAAQNAT